MTRSPTETPGRSRRFMPAAILLLLTAGLFAGQGIDRQDRQRIALWDLELPSIAMPSKDLELAFILPGNIAEMRVKPEQMIERGELLVRLDDKVQAAQVQLAEIAAEDGTELELAKERLALSRRDLDRMEDAHRRGAVNPREMDNVRTTYNLSRIDMEGAEYDVEQNKAVLVREKARLDEMRIHSPIDGIVAEILRDEGESVDEQQIVLRVVNINPLWLDVAIPAEFARTLHRGDAAEVSWRELRDEKPVRASVLFVSSVGDAASNSIRVRLEAPNPELIPGGQHVLVRFLPPEEEQ